MYNLNRSFKPYYSSYCIRLLSLLLVLILVQACSFKVKLVGQYDELLDTEIHQLEAETAAFFDIWLKTESKSASSFEASELFYSDVVGRIQAMQLRASILEKEVDKKPLTTNLKALEQQYVDLQQIHKMPFNKDVVLSAKASLEQSYRAIVEHIIYLKWNQKQPNS